MVMEQAAAAMGGNSKSDLGQSISDLTTALFGTSGSQSASQNGTTTTTYSGDTQSYLDALLRSLSSTSNDTTYSKQSAISDAMGSTKTLMSSLLAQENPGIDSADHTAGGYNNTTTSLLKNDMNSRVIAQGQKNILDNILSYAQVRSNAASTAQGVASISNKSVANVSSATQNNSTKGLLGFLGIS
jgi:hypothetical protein